MKDGADWDDRKDAKNADPAELAEGDDTLEAGADEATDENDEGSLDVESEEGEEENPTVFGPTPLFGSARDLMDRYSHCVVCHSRLHFTHLTDFSRNLSQEIAKCPECNLKVRRVTHRLQ
jgi:hypothetical protein